MGKLAAFSFVTLNGFFEGQKGDISWHRHGAEENGYAAEGLRSGSILLFGRVTYEMMASYWPSEAAIKTSPIIADGMNSAEKVVFSRSLKRADWNNTRVVKRNIVDEVRKMKEEAGKDMTLLGSGSILTQFAEHGIIDEYLIMVDPVVIGSGVTIFDGVRHKLDLKLTAMKSFKSGVVLLSYRNMDA